MGGENDYHEIKLRIDIELVLAQVWYSIDDGEWNAVPPFHDREHGSQMTFDMSHHLCGGKQLGQMLRFGKMFCRRLPLTRLQHSILGCLLVVATRASTRCYSITSD